MSAPEASSVRVVTWMSARLTPGAGSSSMADPPPDTSTRAVSCGPSERARASTSAPCRGASRAGTGWPPQRTASGKSSPSSCAITMPVVTSSSASAAFAMPLAALPKAKSTTRSGSSPLALSSRMACRVQRTGSTAVRAASNRSSASSRRARPCKSAAEASSASRFAMRVTAISRGPRRGRSRGWRRRLPRSRVPCARRSASTTWGSS